MAEQVQLLVRVGNNPHHCHYARSFEITPSLQAILHRNCLMINSELEQVPSFRLPYALPIYVRFFPRSNICMEMLFAGGYMMYYMNQ